MFKSLVFKIWFLFSFFLVGITIALLLIIPNTLKSFFIEDVFSRIELSQEHYLFSDDRNAFMRGNGAHKAKGSDILHIILDDENINMPMFSPSSFEKIIKEAETQREEKKQYIKDFNGIKMLYVIKKTKEETIVSFARASFPESLANKLLGNLSYILILVLVASIPLSRLLAKQISKPLIEIQEHVKNLADRKWDNSFILNSKDEIGNLSLSIESLRKRLLKQDQSQQKYLQHISHELKTPVMVIQSYVESIRDEIYPKGDLNGSLDVINKETVRLNEKIKNLILLTKLDYLSEEKKTYERFSLDTLLLPLVDKYRSLNNNITWIVEGDFFEIEGDYEQISIVFENLFDNQIRYAKNIVNIITKFEEKKFTLILSNDGEIFNQNDPNEIFGVFNKGEDGRFGLGLAIVKQILNQHDFEIRAVNQNNTATFILTFPKK